MKEEGKKKIDFSKLETPKLILVKKNRKKDVSRLLLPQFSLNVLDTVMYLGFYGTFFLNFFAWWFVFPGILNTKRLRLKPAYYWVNKLLKKGWVPYNAESKQGIKFLKKQDISFQVD